jgi:hypothetical protein
VAYPTLFGININQKKMVHNKTYLYAAIIFGGLAYYYWLECKKQENE